MSKLKLKRRTLIKAGAASLFMSGMPVQGFTKGKPPGSISVIILEGGMDGLAAVPPIGDPDLMRMRKSLTPEHYQPLNDFFGLHPSLKFFAQLMAHGHASAVHASAFPYTKRSHFEGQNLIEGGGLSPFAEKSGWLGRALELAGLAGRALSLDMPLILRGHKDNDNFYPASIRGSNKPNVDLVDIIAMGHSREAAQAFKKIARKSETHVQVPRDPASLARYAGQAIAQADGPLASVIRVKQFDTHANQVEEGDADRGRLAQQLTVVDDVIAGYRRGLGEAWNNAIILTLTEFGRTVAVNGTIGSDHGYGSVGLLAGGCLPASRVVADWPGLSKRDQFEKRDLQATIDYRSVCAACLEKSLGLEHDVIASKVFLQADLPRVYEQLFA
ncbi:MAG: DUF1501 domain-containing protein [Gammaproteobacteria bacterium]|nr:DUF1501 domain-containing protein [Gammaproteobacteria bacterium]